MQQVRRRVGFLYIAQAHQVLHSISIAVALARERPDIDVHVLATDSDSLAYAETIVLALGGARLQWSLLGPSWLRAAHRPGQVPPKLPLLAANLRRLKGFDIVVTPERTTSALHWIGGRSPRLVYTQHGAGDREGPFEKRLGRFDLVFAAGAKQRDRMVGEGLIGPKDCAVVGYPKFDVVDQLSPSAPALFAQPRPIVLYNPHFKAGISSWPRWGEQVLRAFAEQDAYNLIFAPHLRLLEGYDARAVPALARYVDHPAIHIDLGTRAAVDMTYTNMADLYLGDVSSQVYEFIRRPRPCAFLNAHGADWQDVESYRHWRFGPVLNGVDTLIADLKAAQQTHAAFIAEQADSFAYTFDMSGPPASQRAARAIAGLLAPPQAAGGRA